MSGSRSTYTRSGGSGSDSRTTSASSYTTATDSRPVSAKLPVIATAQPKGKGLPPVAVKKATVVKSNVVVKKSEQRRPDTASSYSSESGSDSSYSSSSGSDSSYSR